ncbi:MAG: FAD/NAD(P)-binding protein [Anaerolineae bacterium]
MTSLLDQTRFSESIYKPTMARIVDINDLTALDRLFTVELPDGVYLDHQPGQFVKVSVLGVGEAPISISSSPSRTRQTFELAIRKVGDLTGVLHDLQAGAMVGIRGPFGQGFPMDRFKGKNLLFIAGGCGIAPLRSLINQVLDDRGSYGHLQILYGSRSAADLMFKDELHEWENREDVELLLSMEKADIDWPACTTGYVTHLFPQIELDPRNTIAVIIGPPVMYKPTIAQVRNKGIIEGNIWLSFERRMKCGVGKCGHCQINHIYVCRQGPAFQYQHVKDLQEAM